MVLEVVLALTSNCEDLLVPGRRARYIDLRMDRLQTEFAGSENC